MLCITRRFKVYEEQPVGNGGTNRLYQQGWDEI